MAIDPVCGMAVDEKSAITGGGAGRSDSAPRLPGDAPVRRERGGIAGCRQTHCIAWFESGQPPPNWR